MKKKILIVIDSLDLGGAEKSLVTLLNLLDYSKIDVDLQMFAYGGKFQKYIPQNVRILKPLSYFNYLSISFKNKNKYYHLLMLLSQIVFSMKIRLKRLNHTSIAVEFWKTAHRHFKRTTKKYDIAIAYAQGVPTFYVCDKVNATYKVSWINCSYLPEKKYWKYIKNYYEKINKVNCVSEAVRREFTQHFQFNDSKTTIIKDIIDTRINYKLSNEYNVEYSKGYLSLLTVGRLDKHKGYDLAIDTCRILKKKNLKFKWYIIGEGIERKNIEKKISQYNLENHFILLGAKSNPYPYFKSCDIYVQTSVHEGFGITITEAKQFKKPIVTTDFDSVYKQITNNLNGIIVKKDSKCISIAIEKLILNEEERNYLVKNLLKEEVSNIHEIRKFYNLIDMV